MTIFTNKVTRTLIALVVVFMWALPFSLIKVGMAEFGVAALLSAAGIILVNTASNAPK